MQIIMQIATELKAMHEAGYAHRDLKPGNVMWLPSKNRWALIDFGCAAQIGSSAGVACTVAYAAPEICAVLRAGRQQRMPVKARPLVNCA